MKDLLQYSKEKEEQLRIISSIRVDNNYPGNVSSYRSNADIDYARVLYSSSCRRLQGKMQLFIPNFKYLCRNRLTHSHEVAQIAKIIAQKLKLNDTLTVQTCSLAHDIGNPPFGHSGEVVLNKISSQNYEGNAQSFRTLRLLEERHHDFNGLNLTIRSMLGIVKYNQKHSQNPKKFLYDLDYDLVQEWLNTYKIEHKTIDCEIMDLSDEIAYATHDLEDGLKLRYFTIDELLHEFSIDPEYSVMSSEFKKAIDDATKFASKASIQGSSEEYSMLFRKELTSILVNRLVEDIGLTEEGVLGYLSLSKLSKGLKKLTFKSVKRQPDIKQYELLGDHVLSKLFELYSDEKFNENLELMPANYRTDDDEVKLSMINDYIGGMTDEYAIHQYEKYFGSLKDKGIYFK